MQPFLRQVEPQPIASLIKLLGQHADASAPNALKNQALPSTLEATIEFLAPLEAMFQDWPKNYEKHVQARIAAGPQSARTINSLLGYWLRELRKCAEHPPLRVFLDTTLRVCQQQFSGRMGAQDEVPSATEFGFKSLFQAAQLIGTSRDTLKKAVIAGVCEYRAVRYGTKGESYEVSLEEIARIKSLREGWVDEITTCQSLAVTPAVLNAMTEANVIETDRSWRGNIYKGGMFSKASLAHLHQTLSNLSTPCKTEEETVKWSALTSRRMGDKSAIQAVMQAAAKGEIKAVKVSKKLGDFEFLRSDVQRHFGTPLLEAGMSISQLAKATGWKDESISHWIQQQLLEAEQIQLRGQPCRIVLPEQLLRFRQTYMPLADLAKAMGTRSSSLIDKLADVDLVGAKQLPNGAQRGALVRVADLGKWAMAGLQLTRGGLFKFEGCEHA